MITLLSVISPGVCGSTGISFSVQPLKPKAIMARVQNIFDWNPVNFPVSD